MAQFNVHQAKTRAKRSWRLTSTTQSARDDCQVRTGTRSIGS